MIYNITLIIIGLICSIILFYRFPFLNRKDKSSKLLVSVVIPARNEEKTLPFLLSDLQKFQADIHEIICINDGSTDNTKDVILEYGYKLVEVNDKPDKWMGKSWACLKGASVSTGDVILFLDADVRLNKQGFNMLISEYEDSKRTISVQPYHKMEKSFEKLSFIFNIVQVGGNGVTCAIKNGTAGLFGPVILINRKEYFSIGGHSGAKDVILEDLAIGQVLNARGLGYKLFLGGKDVSFRMYSQGIRQIIEGWTKNYAAGAAMARADIFIITFLWISALCSTAFNAISSWFINDLTKIITFNIFYILWVIELTRISKKIGNYNILNAVFYPVYMVFFLVIFFMSVLKKVLKIKVSWKGRKI
ncbi:MAG TPA: glycosyltransferase family 2 protein [Clostridia bacterium]|jgi:4,4'-diaponeurosporenoate glycosyltransferase|nr:MAG: 4,4'-diaponeurosporenoate glycosyltransferase [Firmicutes bacterium ADurb.Bin146]HOD94029.1 glycosyltransferase family 2 protein [Clostridia bacterium]